MRTEKGSNQATRLLRLLNILPNNMTRIVVQNCQSILNGTFLMQFETIALLHICADCKLWHILLSSLSFKKVSMWFIVLEYKCENNFQSFQSKMYGFSSDNSNFWLLFMRVPYIIGYPEMSSHVAV